jgi:hypothetical protein
MQRPIVRMNTDMVAKRSRLVPCGIEMGLSVSRNSPARPSAIAVQKIAVCRGVERSEPKLNTTNSVQRNIMPTSGAT